MAGPIESTSSIPVPRHQTILGARDKTVVTSDRTLQITQEAVTARNEAENTADFEAYLNHRTITVLERGAESDRQYSAKDDAVAVGSGKQIP